MISNYKRIWLVAFLLAIFNSNTHAETALEIVSRTMDSKADPCSDFYRYACGGWLDNTQLSDDEISLTRSFGLAGQDVRNRLYVLFQEAASRYPSGNLEQDRVGAFYQSCMNENVVQQSDLTVLQPYLALIDSINSRESFLFVAGQLQKIGVNSLFSPTIAPNFFDAQTNMVILSSGDPGFPDGDIYSRSDRTSKALRKLGAGYISEILIKLGEQTGVVKRHTSQLMTIEKVLSKYHQTFGNSKSIVYRPSAYFLSGMSSNNLPWDHFFSGAEANYNEGIFVSPDYLNALGRVLGKMPIDALRSYLRWSLISSFRKYLPSRYYRSIQNELIYKTASAPRWKTCVNETSLLLGEAVAKLFSESEDIQQSNSLAKSIMANIKTGFKQSLPQVIWLDSDALAATQAKIDAITEQFGYPAVWTNYENLKTNPGDFLGNVIAARSHSFQQDLARYGQAVDRNAWESDKNNPPQAVNASYIPLKNQIHLLAGLLRAPFLDVNYPAAINYAGLGVVAAHEVMHGFNLNGRSFQSDGHYHPLWTKKVNAVFTQRSQCVKKQYSSYQAAPGLKVNGKITLEENLSDVNGLKLAFLSFKSLLENGSYNVDSQTLSPEQLFFISYAQNFCSLSRSGTTAYISSRSWWRYAPERYRVIGPLVNRPEFAQAFNCPVGSAMNPTKKCTVW